MRRIRALTTLYDNRIGSLQKGETAEVDASLANELVNNKGYAEYADDMPRMVEIDNVQYPKVFVEKSLPEGFPHVEILRDEHVKTFGDLANVRDYREIPHIGSSRAEDIKEGFKKVLNKVRESYGDSE